MTTYDLNLSYECIDAKPLDYEFGSDTWAETSDNGRGWRVCEGSILPEGLEMEIQVDEDEHGDFNLELDPDTFTIDVTTHTEDGDEERTTCDPGDDDYSRFVAYFGLDPDEVQRYIDGDDVDDWMPMMNFAYPLPCKPPEDWKTRMANCTCVEIDGIYYLALTGGGMDFTWEICESYMNLGYFPPVHFAGYLPVMAGRGQSEKDQWIVAGCRKAVKAMRDRMKRALDGLDKFKPAKAGESLSLL